MKRYDESQMANSTIEGNPFNSKNIFVLNYISNYKLTYLVIVKLTFAIRRRLHGDMFPANGSNTVWKIALILKTPGPHQHILCCPLGEFSLKGSTNSIANFLNDHPKMLLANAIGWSNVVLLVSRGKKSNVEKVFKLINLYILNPLTLIP